MAWRSLVTKEILAVKYDTKGQRLLVRFRSGMSAEYAPITQGRYNELVSVGHHHDIDVFFKNMITPFKLRERPTIKFKARKMARRGAFAIAIVSLLVFLYLLNSGVLFHFLYYVLSR